MKCIFALLGVALPVVVHAATLRVPGEYGTLQAGLDAAAVGDTVLVAPGVYSDWSVRTIPWDHGHRSVSSAAFLADGVVLRSEAGPDVTMIDFGTSVLPEQPIAIVGSQLPLGVEIEGFHLTGGDRVGRHGIWLDSQCGDVTVRNCWIDRFDSALDGGPALRCASPEATVTVEDCRISQCAGRAISAGIELVHCDVEVLRTRFLDCAGAALYFRSARPSLVRLADCDFRSDRGHASFALLELNASVARFEMERCEFRNLIGKGARVNIGQESESRITGCSFVRNERGSLAVGGGTHEIRRNTFWANRGIAVSLHAPHVDFRSNIVAGSRIGPALAFLPEDVGLSGCNVFWDNEGGNWADYGTVADTLAFAQEIDPEFCDPGADDLRLAASSPCLPGNGFPECMEVIGALDVGCPATGRSVVAFRTTPDPIPLRIDGVDVETPRLLAWEVGTTHEVGVSGSPTQPDSGTRYWFQSWNDGGAPTHDVTAAGSYAEYVATFSVEHFLSVIPDSGGTASESGWFPEGEVREIFASPDPDFSFQRWVGTGRGSYDGFSNPATVTLEGPIEQHARFVPSFLPLTMNVVGGGVVRPESGLQPRETSVSIEATPDDGWAFSHWLGAGVGSHSGALNPASVFMYGPISQTAVFVDATPHLTMNVVGSGFVAPTTGPQDVFTEVGIEATPDLGWEFDRWDGSGSGSYSGGRNPATVTMNEPITQTARFIVGELPLTVLAEEGGTVTPESGPVTSFTDVEIEAISDPGHRFVRWKGEGDGSYTGTDNPATVTLNGPITQVASFEPSAFSATLSLSDTDPYTHTGAAIGLGNVHLWVTCGTTEHGLRSVRLNAAGSLEPLAFLPAPGVAASGTGSVLASIDGCPDGPVRLGSFLVNSPGEGSLCLDVTGALPGLTITDCEGTVYSWPENVGFVGVHTGGGAPCGGGSGCEAIDSFAAPVGAPDVAAAPTDTRLAGIFPNPFGDGTTIEFEVARAMEVRLSVFDVGGRQVRVLREGSVPAGRHAVGWDGRDSGGRAVSAGVYFVRLTGDGLEQTEKVTVARGRP